MVLDAATQGTKGVSTEQTPKLFEVCRLRDVPILTSVNKLDREGRDPFDLLDEIEQSLALDVTPASWPIGMGRDFLGTYDLFADALSPMPSYCSSDGRALLRPASASGGRLAFARRVLQRR
jgi:peptide chain release factor 3